jgi:hypothetical protein
MQTKAKASPTPLIARASMCRLTAPTGFAALARPFVNRVSSTLDPISRDPEAPSSCRCRAVVLPDGSLRAVRCRRVSASAVSEIPARPTSRGQTVGTLGGEERNVTRQRSEGGFLCENYAYVAATPMVTISPTVLSALWLWGLVAQRGHGRPAPGAHNNSGFAGTAQPSHRGGQLPIRVRSSLCTSACPMSILDEKNALSRSSTSPSISPAGTRIPFWACGRSPARSDSET